MDNQFDQKVAIVTGGASGIGEQIVRAFADHQHGIESDDLTGLAF